MVSLPRVLPGSDGSVDGLVKPRMTSESQCTSLFFLFYTSAPLDWATRSMEKTYNKAVKELVGGLKKMSAISIYSSLLVLVTRTWPGVPMELCINFISVCVCVCGCNRLATKFYGQIAN